MSSAPPDPPSAEARMMRFQAERTRQVYALARYGQPVGVAAAAMLAFGLWLAGGTAWLGLWVLAKLAVLAWEARVWFAYAASDAAALSSPRWERRLALGSGALGVLWGVLPLFTLARVPPGLEVVLVITIVGITSATIGALGASALAFYAYVVPPHVGLLIAYFARGGAEGYTLGALLPLHLLFLVCAQRTTASQFAERVTAQWRNDDLVARLRQADAALQTSLAGHQLLFELASVGIAEIRGLEIVRANPQLEQMLGYDAGTLPGKSTLALLPGEITHEKYNEIGDPLARGLTVARDMQVRRRDGSLIWVALACRAIDTAQPRIGVIAVFNDITDRREREAAMQRLAHEDALTGLPNRRLLEDRLAHALQRARRHGGCVALLLIDLDGFKSINDSHGHDAGDQVLAAVGRRLQHCVRACDTVSRLGGDEFVVLLDDPVQPDDASRIAQTLVGAASEPIAVGAHLLQVGASVGISIAPSDGMDGEALLRRADEAMYRAKQSGRGVWRRYADGRPAA